MDKICIAIFQIQRDITLRGKKLLEFGCGTGNMTLNLKN